jgi:biopolymer transport protein ExbD
VRARRLRHHDQGVASELNVTPLIDVVMCLIIFFLLVGKLSLDAGIKLPGSGVGQNDAASSIIISIVAPTRPGSQPLVLINSQPVEGELSEAIARAVRIKVTPVLTGSATGGRGTDATAIAVKVRADKELPYSAIDPVLQACAKAGLTSVRLVTERPT